MKKNDKSACIAEAEQQEVITSLKSTAATEEMEKTILVMDSKEALENATENYKKGKMGFIEIHGEDREITYPVI